MSATPTAKARLTKKEDFKMTTAFFDAKIDFKSLADEVSHLETLRQKIVLDGWPENPHDFWVMLSAMSASIEKSYSSAERILKNLLQELDGSIPSSQDWHRQLIDRAASIGPYGRPALMGQELANTFHDLSSFRHRERNSYVAHLDPQIVLEKSCIAIQAFHAFGDLLDHQGLPETDFPAQKDVQKS